MVDSLKLGGDGGVNGGANVFPKLFVQCHAAARRGDLERTEALQRCIDTFQQIYTVGKYASRFIKATKCALSLQGICDDHMAEPFNRFLPPERERVDRILQDLLPELNELLGGDLCSHDRDPSNR